MGCGGRDGGTVSFPAQHRTASARTKSAPPSRERIASVRACVWEEREERSFERQVGSCWGMDDLQGQGEGKRTGAGARRLPDETSRPSPAKKPPGSCCVSRRRCQQGANRSSVRKQYDENNSLFVSLKAPAQLREY